MYFIQDCAYTSHLFAGNILGYQAAEPLTTDDFLSLGEEAERQREPLLAVQWLTRATQFNNSYKPNIYMKLAQLHYKVKYFDKEATRYLY